MALARSGVCLFLMDAEGAVQVLQNRTVVCVWRFSAPIIAVSAGSGGVFLALDAAGRLHSATLERDDRGGGGGARPCVLPYPTATSLPLLAAEPAGDIFEDEMRLGSPGRGADDEPAAKRPRLAAAPAKGDEPAGLLGRCEGASCAVWAGADTVYCGRSGVPVARCRVGAGLAVDGEGQDRGGTRCMVAVGVDGASGGEQWPGLVNIDACLMGALCGTELALLGRPVLLQGGIDGALRASSPASGGGTIAQTTVCELHEPTVCVVVLRAAVVLVGAAGRLLVVTAGEDGMRRTYQRQLPGPVASAVVLQLGSDEGGLSAAVVLVSAGGALYATGLQHGDAAMGALHLLPLGDTVAHVAEGAGNEAVVLLADTGLGRRGDRLLWLTAMEVLERVRSGLHILDASQRPPPEACSDSSRGTAEGSSALRLQEILGEISALGSEEKLFEVHRKAADGKIAAANAAVSALHLYAQPNHSPRVGFRLIGAKPAGKSDRDGGPTQLSLEVLFDNPAAFALCGSHTSSPTTTRLGRGVSKRLLAIVAGGGGAAGDGLWALSVQVSEFQTGATSSSLAGPRWNFGFSLPHGMKQQARLMTQLPGDLADLARRAPLQLAFHLTMQFGDAVGASAHAGIVLPLYKTSRQGAMFRQADTLHFLHPASRGIPGNQAVAAQHGHRPAAEAAPCRLRTLQELFHPAASAPFTGAQAGGGGDESGGVGLGNSSTRLELVMCGGQPGVAAVGAEQRIMVPPQPAACKVLEQILNDGGSGGAVVAGVVAEIAAAAQSDDGGNPLDESASVTATYGPTGSSIHIGVQRITESVSGDGGESHHLCIYRLSMSAESAAVLAMLHSALINRALKIDEQSCLRWQRLSEQVAQHPALREQVAALQAEQLRMVREQQEKVAESRSDEASAATSLEHRRITQKLGSARDQERALRQMHEAMCDGESLTTLSAALKRQAADLCGIWKTLRNTVAL